MQKIQEGQPLRVEKVATRHDMVTFVRGKPPTEVGRRLAPLLKLRTEGGDVMNLTDIVVIDNVFNPFDCECEAALAGEGDCTGCAPCDQGYHCGDPDPYWV